MTEIKTPTLEPTIPRMSRDEAAAAWFLFLQTIEVMTHTENPMSVMIAKACALTARNTGDKIRKLDSRSLAYIIKENARGEIISGT